MDDVRGLFSKRWSITARRLVIAFGLGEKNLKNQVFTRLHRSRESANYSCGWRGAWVRSSEIDLHRPIRGVDHAGMPRTEIG